MKMSWRRSILSLTTLAVFGVAALVGALFIELSAQVTNERTERQWAANLDALLETVESTVGIACFVEDQALAGEVARGLLKNQQVLGVAILVGERVLARSHHPTAGSTQTARALKSRLVRPIASPFKSGERVCEIQLDPNLEEFDRITDEQIRFEAVLLGFGLFAVVVAVVGVVLQWIVRPIMGMSDALHGLDATAGTRLRTPRGHAGTEIGRLAEDINGLAGRLVATLEQERALRLQRELDERKYRAIFDHAESGIFIVDAARRLESWNPALERLLDLGVPADQGADAKHPALAALGWREPTQLMAVIGECIERNATRAGELEFRGSDGATRWLSLLVSPIGGGMVQGVVSDVTELKLAEASAQMRAVTDPLTGLANRPGLEQSLHAMIRRHGADPDCNFALMLIDLDGFRRVNEALGLPVGDQVLKCATERLRGCLKTSDTVARIGGDEFVVMAPQAARQEYAASIGERIARVLCAGYEINGAPILLGVSIGITLFPNDGTDVPTVLRNVELALDRARAAGGNRYTFFDPAMAEAAEHRRAMETDLHLALRRDEFALFFQPIVDLAANRLVGAEALIRWRHPEKGMVPPDAFIPLAEETGLIVDIGLWALETTCLQLAQWRAAGFDRYISLNVSGRQIPDGLPPAKLAEAIQRHGIEASRLVLEITEGVLLRDVARAQAWLADVRALGIRVYLDDFGTGYSSLSYLKRFPVNTVKVDKSFVREMGVHASDRALVEAIIAMSRSLGLQVVAEGVETVDQLALLRAMGCHNAQGYYFSRPVPAQEFAAVADKVAALLATGDPALAAQPSAAS